MFEDFPIDDGVSDGETDPDLRTDTMMRRDRNTNQVSYAASRSKIQTGKKYGDTIIFT